MLQRWNCLKDLEGIAVIVQTPFVKGFRILLVLRSQEWISKSSPLTTLWRCSYIAQQAGFKNYENYVDCSKISDDQLVDQAEKQPYLWVLVLTRKSTHQTLRKRLVGQLLWQEWGQYHLLSSWSRLLHRNGWEGDHNPSELPILFFWTLTF